VRREDKTGAGVTYEYGLRVNCAMNGCGVPHSDDGVVLLRSMDAMSIEKVNGHLVTPVVRSVTRSEWRDLEDAPAVDEYGHDMDYPEEEPDDDQGGTGS